MSALKRVFILCLVFGLVGLTYGGFIILYTTGEGSGARTVAHWITEHAKKHEGDVPTSWGQVTELWDGGLPEPYFHPTWRYALLDPPVDLSLDADGEAPPLKVVAMHRKGIYEVRLEPIIPVRGPGRYLVYEDRHGKDYYTRWIEEEQLVAAFAAAKRTLPLPDTEPLSPAVKEALFWLAVKLCIVALVWMWALWPVVMAGYEWLIVRWWVWTGMEWKVRGQARGKAVME